MTLSFGKYKAYADICRGSSGWGRRYIFGNVRDKASNITWQYATPCRPIIDSKVNDLE